MNQSKTTCFGWNQSKCEMKRSYSRVWIYRIAPYVIFLINQVEIFEMKDEDDLSLNDLWSLKEIRRYVIFNQSKMLECVWPRIDRREVLSSCCTFWSKKKAIDISILWVDFNPKESKRELKMVRWISRPRGNSKRRRDIVMVLLARIKDQGGLALKFEGIDNQLIPWFYFIWPREVYMAKENKKSREKVFAKQWSSKWMIVVTHSTHQYGSRFWLYPFELL